MFLEHYFLTWLIAVMSSLFWKLASNDNLGSNIETTFVNVIKVITKFVLMMFPIIFIVN